MWPFKRKANQEVQKTEQQFPPEIVEELGALYSPYLSLKDALEFQPYLMSQRVLNHTSQVINTDEFGYRVCVKDGREIPVDEFRAYEGHTGAVVGGSVIFGSAATADKYTLNNQLNQLASGIFWNCGVGACNGFVEILSYLLLNKTTDIVLNLSGANDLFLHIGGPRRYPVNFPFEGEESFYNWNLGNGSRQIETETSDELDDFIELCKSLPMPLSENHLNLLIETHFIKDRYQACLEAIRTQLEIFNRVCQDRLVYILNPHLHHCKAVHEREDLYYRIALSRMPHFTGCLRMITREIYPALQKDLRDLCDSLDVFFLDANNFTYGDGICFIDDFHPTDLGFNKIARNIVQSIPQLQEREQADAPALV